MDPPLLAPAPAAPRSGTSACRRPSLPPDAPALRAKSLGKLRNPARQQARELGVVAMHRAARDVSDGALGAELSGHQDGAQIRTGAIVLTAHEVAHLLPIEVASDVLLDALQGRIERELREEQAGPAAVAHLTNLLAQLIHLRALATAGQRAAAGQKDDAIDVLLAALRLRITTELQCTDLDSADTLRLNLALTHLSAIHVLRTTTAT